MKICHAVVVRVLFEAGADVNVAGFYGATSLHNACKSTGHAPTVRAMIKAGVDVNKANDFGATPLNIAEEGRIDKKPPGLRRRRRRKRRRKKTMKTLAWKSERQKRR